MEYIAMNPHDIDLLHSGKLTVFAIPKGKNEIRAGDILGVKESFRKVTAHIINAKSGEPEYDIIGVRYTSDNKVVWEGGVEPPDNGNYTSDIEEAPKRTSAKLLPEYAVRRHRRVISAGEKPLQDFTKEDIAAMGLDYASQGNPQIVMDCYESIKDYELLFAWWKERYKTTLKKTDDPMAVILHLGLE